jgi:hypothetical protein
MERQPLGLSYEDGEPPPGQVAAPPLAEQVQPPPRPALSLPGQVRKVAMRVAASKFL